MRQSKPVTKWVAGLLVLGMLLSMVFMTGGFRPAVLSDPIPHGAAQISTEAEPSAQGSGDEPTQATCLLYTSPSPRDA